MNPIIIDVETNIKNYKVGKNRASPFYTGNKIVAFGSCVEGDICMEHERDTKIPRWGIIDTLEQYDMLVGHNIKFDLLYIRKTAPNKFHEWVKNGGCVWDTMVVEYLLQGQDKKVPSLDYCSEKYGGTLKDDKIKEYWNEGIDTSEIDRSELLEYLKHDLLNTELVFENQLKQVNDAGMFDLVMTQMNALMALTEIEHNGMHFEKELVYMAREGLLEERDDIFNNLVHYMRGYIPLHVDSKEGVSPTSDKQVSAYLFGGNLKVNDVETVLDGDGNAYIYKSGKKKGQVKTRKVKKNITVKGHGIKPPEGKGKSGYFPVNEDVIKKLMVDADVDVEPTMFCVTLLKFRAIEKDITTYYDGLMSLTWEDNIIHPNYNQAITGTGRLSSSAPNGQNISGKKDE